MTIIHFTIKMLVAVLLLFVIILLYGLSFYMSSKDYRIKLSKIKSVPSLPIIGHAHKFARSTKDILPVLEDMWIKCGRDKFLLKIGLSDHVIITNPKDVEAILVTHRVITKSALYKDFSDLVGEGLLTCEPQKWHSLRKVLTPAFYSQVLESYEDVYKSQANNILNDITENIGQDVELINIFFKAVLATLTASGVGVDVDVNEDSQYLSHITKLIGMTNEKVFSPWKSISFLYNLSADGKIFKEKLKWVYERNARVLKNKKIHLQDLMTDIDSRRNNLENMTGDDEFGKRRLGFLDLLLLGRKNCGEPLTTDEIIVEVLTFTIAGIETTAAAASFTLYNLSLNPHIQNKVIEEQLLITGKDLKQPVTVKDTKEMKYLELVIKESMRTYSSVVFFGRELTEDIALSDKTVLPKGANILFLPFFSHRHPDVFPDPEKFNPDRFVHGTITPGSYYPFGLGPRDCIGKGFAMLQLKFYLSTLLRSIEFLPPKGSPPKLSVELGLKSLTGVNVSWQFRQ